MKKILGGIAIIFFALVLVIIVRTITFKEPSIETFKNTEFLQSEQFKKYQKDLVAKLQKSITYKTVSYQDASLRDTKEFQKLIEFLKNSFPLVHKQLELKLINQFTLLYKWKGKNPELKPVVLMGHYDVVPVNEKEWTVPPFEGKIIDDYLYGRGTIDDKITVIGLLQAVEYLLSINHQPERTIYFSFGHDEEIGGVEGAKSVVSYLQQNQIFPAFVMDEGGAITIGMVPGVEKPVATIGIAEKGYVSIKLIATSRGGHSSTPPEDTAVTRLTRALYRLQENPFPYGLTDVQKTMFRYVGPNFSFVQKMAAANLWLFRPVIESILKKSDTGRASLHTTMTPTILKAGIKENIIPTEAEAVINLRILPGDSIESIINRIKKIIQDDNVRIEILPFSSEPSPVSGVEGEDGLGFQMIVKTIKTINSEYAIAPYLVLGATDSRYFKEITKNIYRFMPVYLNEEDMHRMHGNDERISLKSIQTAFEFYSIFIKNL
jgi:carboxypeptidase PM20D1